MMKYGRMGLDTKDEIFFTSYWRDQTIAQDKGDTVCMTWKVLEEYTKSGLQINFYLCMALPVTAAER
jgi:hypothetical protein